MNVFARFMTRPTVLRTALLLVWLFARAHAPKAAELIRISEDNWREVAPHGKEADWIYGDYVLRNRHVVAVIGQPTSSRHANMTVRAVGGCIIDFSSRTRSNDQLSAYFPGGGYFVFSQPEEVRESLPNGLSAEAPYVDHVGLRLRGTPNPDLSDHELIDGLDYTVTYLLADDAKGLRLESRIENRSNQAKQIRLLDVVRADRDFESTVDKRFNLFCTEDFWWRQAYGVVASDYVVRLEQQTRNLVVHFEDEQHDDGVVVSPGESITLVRFLSQAPDGVALRANIHALRGESTCETPVRVIDADGAVPGGKLVVHRVADDGEFEIGKLRTDRDGRASLPLAIGTYRLTATGLGRQEVSRRINVTGEPTDEIVCELAPTGHVSVRVRDAYDRPVACKVCFEAVDAESQPFFGPDTYVWEVHNLIYTEDGTFRHELPPGRYQVLISHGPEYDAVYRQITVEPGKRNEVLIETKLTRSVDTTGWISADFHSHSSPSGDNTSSQLGRVMNLLAEHIEFAPCTEHNRISSYVPHLKRLRATDRMATCSGIELTGSPLPINHQNAFPLIERLHRQDGGAPSTDADPVKQIRRLADWDEGSDKVVQQNHPNIVRILCDTNDDGEPDDGHRGMLEFMDLIEIHPPGLILSPPEPTSAGDPFSNPSVRWLQLLNLGYRIYGAVNTDAHYNYHGSGFLRNFVKSQSDDPAELVNADLVAACRRGNIVMSNGPFLNVSALSGDATAVAGEDLAAKEGKVRLFITVQCPNWLDVNRVQILLNGRPQEKFNFKRRSAPTKFRNGTVKFEDAVDIELQCDTHLIVVALGEGLTLGPVMGPKNGMDTPVAVTNPIFIDVDGGGFRANGDLLDMPLPANAEVLRPGPDSQHHHHHPDSQPVQHRLHHEADQQPE